MKISMLPVRPAAMKTAVIALISLSATMASAQDTHTIFPLSKPSVSTVTQNGDVNPYGVFFVPTTVMASAGLKAGDILVSNFNNSNNLQGLGTSILHVNAAGQPSTFFIGSSARSGLTAALGVLTNGWVIVGNLPTLDGTAATVQPGAISVLDSFGNFLGNVGTVASVNGPWGMAVFDQGSNGTGKATVFVSNVLSGAISRFTFSYTPTNLGAVVNILSTGFNHRTDPAAIVLGPSGLVYDAANDTLYVASSTDNAVYAIPTATAATALVTPKLLFQDATHLHGPLDLSILPNGHFLIANSDGSNVDPNQPSELVEYTQTGEFVGQMPIDPNNGGAFGLATTNIGWGTFRLAAVDDNTNSLNIWTTVAQ